MVDIKLEFNSRWTAGISNSVKLNSSLSDWIQFISVHICNKQYIYPIYLQQNIPYLKKLWNNKNVWKFYWQYKWLPTLLSHHLVLKNNFWKVFLERIFFNKFSNQNTIRVPASVPCTLSHTHTQIAHFEKGILDNFK